MSDALETAAASPPARSVTLGAIPGLTLLGPDSQPLALVPTTLN